jgi:F420-dependent oxidoreductase-like protein
VATLTFGIKTAPQDVTYDEILTVWRDADAIDSIEHAWLFDHFAPINGHLDGPCLEGWTLLAALAAETKRLRLGLMVTGNTYRHPAVLAKIAATVDVISNGRLDLGIGAGWNVYEHESMGIPLYAPGERIRRFGEACAIIKSLFTEHLTTFDGRYYQLKDARCEPKPIQKPYPPFVIGGSGEQLTLRVVAEYAQVWNFGGTDPEQFKHKVKVLREHCAAVGRDPSEIALSIQIQVFPDDLQKTIDTVQSLVDVGANHIILNLRPPIPAGIVARVAEEVIPKIVP